MDKLVLKLDVADVERDGLAGLAARSPQHRVQLAVATSHGPGGGNPVVELRGSREGLQAWLEAEYTQDPQGVEDLLSLAVAEPAE